MSQATANLALPLIAAAQASKHVTHNEALTALDSLVQLACLDKDLAAPPAGPREGDRYLVVTPSPAGPWAGLSGQVVRYHDGSWIGFAPKAGWFCWVVDEGDLYTFDGTAWIGFRATLTAFQNLARLGVGTTADAGNPFAAKLNAALWTALGTGEGGTGDLRYTLKKEAAARTLSLLMQTGFSGRAEIGLTGDDDLHVKVSANGSAFLEALRVNRSNGTLAHVAGTAAAPALAPAGDANTGVFSPGADAWAVATGGIERLRVGSDGRLGLGTATPRSTLDTGLGTLTGAANDYGQAQTTLSGGGSVSWGGAGGRLRWTGRFLAMPMSRPTAQNGYIAITQPTTDIPAAQCWDNLARTADPTGIVLTPWDALYAVHPPGGTASSVTLWVVNYASAFVAPSNWLLVAAHNGDDNTIKLGTGAILRAGGTATAGTDAHYAPRLPSPDNTLSLGGPANRYATLYAATGAINTSDAREKSPLAPLSAAEIAASVALGRRIGTFRFLEAVRRKGAAARLHVGLTVQEAIGVLEAHGLDPFAFGFICHDVLDPDPEASAGTGAGAGDRYGFRSDELVLFLARGFEARLTALEAA
ncbi:DUF2793 domain-containing protein [Methylobacterium sp. Leaf108]|uniref:DUF2793 domain-containing protein n=1 Tax=Methylobacterium sp. Leaf108 TaxID=1736256 RepID=UPI0006F7A602|nr:DUF2793 domain-containing protein [Methylobacterium sp. Leaf108]KQP61693.1 hypothetical protein ASF39_03225 [Methylobacterium sp. Leaf108]